MSQAHVAVYTESLSRHHTGKLLTLKNDAELPDVDVAPPADIHLSESFVTAINLFLRQRRKRQAPQDAAKPPSSYLCDPGCVIQLVVLEGWGQWSWTAESDD